MQQTPVRDQFLALIICIGAIVAGLSALAMIAGLLVVSTLYCSASPAPHRRFQLGGTMDLADCCSRESL